MSSRVVPVVRGRARRSLSCRPAATRLVVVGNLWVLLGGTRAPSPAACRQQPLGAAARRPLFNSSLPLSSSSSLHADRAEGVLQGKPFQVAAATMSTWRRRHSTTGTPSYGGGGLECGGGARVVKTAVAGSWSSGR